MKSKKVNERFTFTEKTSSEPLSENEIDELIDILTDMMAARYVAEHPDQFEKPGKQGEVEEVAQSGDGKDKTQSVALTECGEIDHHINTQTRRTG